jgi:hypothetical protein
MQPYKKQQDAHDTLELVIEIASTNVDWTKPQRSETNSPSIKRKQLNKHALANFESALISSSEITPARRTPNSA